MKKIIISFLLIYFLTNSIYSQSGWEKQNYFSYKGNVNDIIQFNMEKVIAIGDFGVIYVSNNGGEEFREININSYDNLISLSFINQETGYVCGQNGIILKTTNSGYNWSKLNSGTTDKLFDVQALGNNLVFCVGEKGRVLKSTNGGASWVQKNFDENYYLIGVKFSDNITGYSVGWPGKVIKTTNSGENWYEVNTGIYFPFQYTDIDIRNNLAFIAGDNSKILRSTDFGMNWDSVSTCYNCDHPIYKVKIFNDSEAIFIGDVNFYTNDTGKSFSGPGYSNARGFDLINIDSGYFCGEKFVSRKNSDPYNGEVWLPFNIYKLDIISAIDENNCWVIGDGGYYPYTSNHAYQTNNSGNKWNFKKIYYDRRLQFTGIKFYDLNIGFLAGSDVNNDFILKTTDGGINWYQVYYDTTYTYNDFKNFFRTSTTLYVFDAFNKALISTNNGMNWTIHPNFSNYGNSSVTVITDSIFYAVTPNYTKNILKSTNAGLFWDTLIHYIWQPDWQDISFINESTGFFVGARENVIRTTDGGHELTEITLSFPPNYSDILNDVQLVDSEFVYIVSSQGNIFRSTNLGNSWENQHSGVVNSLNYVEFINRNTGWVVGDNGIILHTTNAGSLWNNNNNIVYKYTLSQNYPNPFNPSTTIKFQIPEPGNVSIKVYDITGREVESLLTKFLNPGEYRVSFIPKNLATGVYFYTLIAENYKASRKMVLIK